MKDDITIDGKKINLQTHATQATTIINPKGDFSMNKTLTQYLPEEFLTQQRFFPVTIREKDGAKVPMLTGWKKPDNQLTFETAAKKSALLGFDISGHEQGVDYLFFDFDHVLDDNGEFVNDDAQKWFELILKRIGGYCERSISGHGIHILAKPTAGKFAPVSAGKQGVLYFDKDNNVKLEIFYKTGRYCLMTGNLFRTKDRNIAAGAVADEVFSDVLAEIQARAKKTAKSAKVDEKPKTAPTVTMSAPTPQPARTPQYQRGDSGYSIDDDPAYKEFRINRMLDTINPSALEDSDWLAVISACKNEGVPYAVVDAFNHRDPNRYNADENQSRWDSVADTSFNIETLHGIAKNFGYDERESQRDWYQLHPELSARARSTRLSALKAQPQSKKRDEQILEAIRDMCSWSYRKNEAGKIVKTSIKSTYRNIECIFDNDPNLNGLFGFDNFQGEIVFLRKAPWHDEDRTGETWRGTDAAQLRAYLRRNYAELKEQQLIEDYVIVHASQHSFNAVKKFYETLPDWDGTPRAEKLFVKFLGAADTDYTREVTMKWLLGAIARVYHPGCDFQWAPVLQGAQRIGKSKLVKMLGGKEGVSPNGYQWHVALKDSVDDAHAIDALSKGAIIEIEEFSAARRAEINALKSFISADDDTRRFSFDRNTTTRKRHCVFIVTCNDQQFLRDPTGNARFWIVKCAQQKFKRVEGMTPDYIRQVWAEVYFKYNELFKDGFDESKLKPSLELEIRAEEIAEAYIQDDGMTTEIKAFLDKKLPPAIIWRLMNKEDRRKFFVDGSITFDIATLNHRRRAQGGREQDIERDIDAIYNLCNSQRTDIQKITVGNETQFRLYGCELREHICAAEIFNECFGTGDKRKLMYRFHEILDTLEGWHLGERLQKADPEYREQKKPYYRNEDNRPTDDSDATDTTQDESKSEVGTSRHEDFQESTIAPCNVLGFDPDDLPFDNQ